MDGWEDNGQDPDPWILQLADWKEQEQAATDEQHRARDAFDAAEARVGTLRAWGDRLAELAEQTLAHTATADSVAAESTTTRLLIEQTSAELQDHQAARDTATARLLDGPPVSEPVVLLPLRLQTAWTSDTLTVRIYPGELHVNGHDPRLSEVEVRLADGYWATRSLPGAEQFAQAWQDLSRRVGGPRAAWIVSATAPNHKAKTRDTPWDLAVHADLLPEVFAVVAYSAGEPVDVGNGAPRFVSWCRRTPDPMALSALHQHGGTSWTDDLPTALASGMAVTIPAPSGGAVDALVVVGVRTGEGSLADLLEAQAYSVGLEFLPDGTATNNNAQVRAAHTRTREEEVAALLVAPDRPTDCAPGTGGAQVAALLGLPTARLAAVAGAQEGRQARALSMAAVVGAAAQGPVRELAGVDGWSVVEPGGPSPTLRVGRQPYGVLPATAPSRWRTTDGDPAAALTGVLAGWASSHPIPVDIDPSAPPAPRPPARTAGPDDGSDLTTLLLEHPASLAWASQDDTYAGLDALVGTADGDNSAAVYLTALAEASDAELDTVASHLPDTLLARIALSARRATGSTTGAGLADELRTLAGLGGAGDQRVELALLLNTHLDALSHRIDAWVTAAATTRVRAQRAASIATTPSIGAYGYLADLAPRTSPRSSGHVHAPSLAHAATAAVLRSGYLGRRGLAAATDATNAPDADVPLAINLSSQRVRQSQRILGAVREGQPLAAVLGHLLETDLTDAGLQRYLPSLRKLTRFTTGSALEALEATRREAQRAFGAAQVELGRLRQLATQAAAPVNAATLALQAAEITLQAAQAADQPYENLRTELATLQTTIAKDEQNLADAIEGRKYPTIRTRIINVP